MLRTFAACAALLSGTAALAANETVAQEKTAERLICKRGQETGSRTRSPKMCFTASQWRALQNKADQANASADGEKMARELPIQSGGFGAPSPQ